MVLPGGVLPAAAARVCAHTYVGVREVKGVANGQVSDPHFHFKQTSSIICSYIELQLLILFEKK